MDVFNEEFVTFWKTLNEYEVRFIMVGGVATNLNGYQRSTDDIDVWLEDTLPNRRNFRKAFEKYSSIDFFMLETMQFVPGWSNLNLNNGMRLDIMVGVKGLENIGFEDCLNAASIADIDGAQVPFLHINHLIESKKAANRGKDQIDVIYLEELKKLREEENVPPTH